MRGAKRSAKNTAKNISLLVLCGLMGALTVFLCSSGAGYINGVDILTDGGQNAGIFVPQI